MSTLVTRTLHVLTLKDLTSVLVRIHTLEMGILVILQQVITKRIAINHLIWGGNSHIKVKGRLIVFTGINCKFWSHVGSMVFDLSVS